MVRSNAAKMDAAIQLTERRLTALVRQSVQTVVNNANTPVAKGGKMRVDTGFLRASGQMSLTGVPSGPVRGEKTEPESYDLDSTTIITSLVGYALGTPIYYGWTADYARHREAKDGFLEAEIQDWDNIVARVARQVAFMV